MQIEYGKNERREKEVRTKGRTFNNMRKIVPFLTYVGPTYQIHMATYQTEECRNNYSVTIPQARRFD